jgi:hypothetical protein
MPVSGGKLLTLLERIILTITI